MSVSDVVFTMVPDVTNMALPYCGCGLSMAKSIPDMLGRMASGPRCVSWMHTTAHMCRCLWSAMSCSFAADSLSTLKDILVRAGPEKGPLVRLWLVSRFLGSIFFNLCESGSRIADLESGRARDVHAYTVSSKKRQLNASETLITASLPITKHCISILIMHFEDRLLRKTIVEL